MNKYKKGDILKERSRLGFRLECGKVYRLGITMFNYMFGHYEVIKIMTVNIHNAYSISYLCQYEDDTVAYRWDSGHDIRIITAELMEKVLENDSALLPDFTEANEQAAAREALAKEGWER